MIIDNFLNMADAITVGSSTAAVVTTSYIDTIAESDDYAGCFIVHHAETAVLSGTAGATVTFSLQHCDTTISSAFTDLVTSGPIDDALVVAGYLSKLRIPTGTKRYLRGTITTTQVTTSGTVSVFIAKDVDVNAQLIA
jgi:hypothetical protein